MENNNLTRYIALDCEMVGAGKNYRQDMLARVTLVNEQGKVVYDKYVKPTRPVTDYRTTISGIRKSNLENGENFHKVQQEVKDKLEGRILVGHALESDLAILGITHPEDDVRDTGFYFEKFNNNKTPALRWLAKQYLGISIQTGEHSSAVDARTAMKLYKMFATKWEREIANN